MAEAADEIIAIAREIAKRKEQEPPPVAAPKQVVSEKYAKEPAAFAQQPRNLPFVSLESLFVGREPALAALSAALLRKSSAAVALHGLGGIGKTRLAIEYAWAHAAEYSALLFLRADSSATFDANLAALVGSEFLDLPEKDRARTWPRSRQSCIGSKPTRPGS